MIVSHRLKLIYIHIPKTAGTSISAALIPYMGAKVRNNKEMVVGTLGWQKYLHVDRVMHTGYSKKGSESLTAFPNYRVLISVRNPWDRFASMARNLDKTMGRSNWSGDLWDLLRRLSPRCRGFSRRYWFQPCAAWLPRGERIAPVHVLRFERLDEDWREVCGELGLNGVELPHENRADARALSDWHDYYKGDQDLIDAVGRRYHDDIVAFKYTF